MSEQIQDTQLSETQQTLWKKAKAAIDMKNYGYAVSLLKPLVKENPEFLEGRKILRMSEVQLSGGKKKKGGLFGGMKKGGISKKDPKAALADLEDALESDPYNETYNEQMYHVGMRMNNPDLAAFALETVRASKPDKTKLLHLLAEHYLARDLPDKAIEVFRDILKIDPADGVAVKGEKDSSARASMKKQNWENAQGMSGLLRKDNDQGENEKSSRSGMTRDQMEERLAGLYEKYNEDNENLGTSKQIAALLEQLENWTEALTFYNWAYSLSNGDVSLKNKAGEIEERIREQQIAQLEEALEADPSNDELRNQIAEARAAGASQRVEDAKKRVEQNPTDPSLRFALGSALFDMGNPSDAIPELQRARNNPHLRTKAMLLLGQAYQAKNMYDLAVKTLGDAIDELHGMDGTKKDLLYNRGVILEEMDRREEALESFKLIYDADYGYRDVAQKVESSYGD